ncbi:hypothetical protein ACJW30_09G078800 [Castanea mollissima]
MRIQLFSRLLQILICSLTLISAVSGQCLRDQQSYLLEFKNSLNFNSTLSTKLGCVVSLDLNNESIYGRLHSSSSLFRLHYLQHLNLANNYFYDSYIPPEFGNLTNLSYLNLSNAGISEQIPIEISRLTRLNPNLATLVRNLKRLTELYLDALSSSLPNLRVLNMSYCDLPGPLDSSLQKLQSLSIINLNANNFYAPVPEFFADFRNLTSLNLRSCGLNGQFPKKIFQVPTLQTVDLSGNQLLQGSLPEFYPNGSLQSLLLRRTNFSGTLPDSIDNLKRLSDIYFSECNFTGSIPNSITNLTQLVYLDIIAKNLTMIDLSYNNLIGQITFSHGKELQRSIPASLFLLPSLRKLHLGNNHFSGQLLEFSNVSSFLLEELDLNNNYLEGPIPISIFELQGLHTLSLSSNNFNGSFQLNVIQQLRNLTTLDLSYNNLLIEYNGTNSSLSSFPQIEKLVLASNKLKIFPEFLRNQANLVYLDLSDNQIHGEIPNWFWKLPELSFGQLPTPLPFFNYLDLSMNNFNSVIPVLDLSWNDSNPSIFLSLSNNKIHGQIPESICNATFVGALDLSNDFINGTIPHCFSSMSKSLWVLNLRRNNLTGKISDTFPISCQCSHLEVLDVGNNQIHDAFPCYLKGISNLRVLVLQSNKFYGSVGCEGPNVTWPKLQIVDLASNNFSGKLSIKAMANSDAMMVDNEAQSELNYLHFHDYELYYPDVVTITFKHMEIELKILTILTLIDLSCNNLEGPIPEEIGVLKSLYSLNLSHNAFTGRIPPSLGNLSKLESLDLSSNELSGEIPMQLANNLTFLSVLNLSFNQLVGPVPYIKQYATFLETSFEGNKGLCGSPLKTTCTSTKPSSPPPTFKDSNSNSRPLIDWNYLSVELGFVFGLGMIIWPLVFCKRWRIWYCKHADDILFGIFPQLYLGGNQHR